MASVRCPSCGWIGKNLELHYGQSPACRPGKKAPREPLKLDKSHAHFARRVRYHVGKELMRAHYELYIKVAHLDIFLQIVLRLIAITLEYVALIVEHEFGETCPGMTDHLEKIGEVFNKLPSAATIINEERRSLTKIDVYHRGVANKKTNAFFSVIQLLTQLLQHNGTVRRHVIEASERWKTGDLHNVPADLYDDVTAGSRFRSNARLVGTATGEDPRRPTLRIGLHAWMDEYTTVDGLATKAGDHKYNILLMALLNLPLYMRHYFDHLLLIAIFQSKYAAKNGGTAAMLCGTEGDPSDTLTLRSELAVTHQAPVLIALPDDQDPTGSGVAEFGLVVDLVLISLDWLAQGDFGPYSTSVAARHPCPKCMWTAACGCAFMHAGDPRRQTMSHSELCCHRAPRTQQGVMAAVHEFRAWSGNKTELAKRRTAIGIFHDYFASEHLLPDLVKDVTIDGMHVFLCGLSRYLWSWVSDDLIPRQFGWDDLNHRRKLTPLKTGHKVPHLKRKDGTNRGSTSAKLTAAETLSLIFASDDMIAPLVTEPERPSWLCWQAHVRLVRFILRPTFQPSDLPVIDELVAAFLLAFEAVPQWTGYEKPKFHLLDHLSEAIRDHGPLRAFWCMPWEAFLQLVKRMFDMTNYKSAPTTVMEFWIAKASMQHRDQTRASWYDDEVETSSDWHTDIPQMCAKSRLIRECVETLGELPNAVRFLRSVQRGHAEVGLNDHVLLQSPVGDDLVGRVMMLAQLRFTGDEESSSQTIVRMWCEDCAVPITEGDQLRVSSDAELQDTLVRYESTVVTVMSRTACGDDHLYV